MKSGVNEWLFAERCGITNTLLECDMYRSFAALRMTPKRIHVILNEVKDLYIALTVGTE